MEITSIKGFRDILPEEVGYWQRLESVAREVLGSFGFLEVKLPLMEKTELFSRSIGQETDIVSKEMYSFKPSKHELAMRPEGTAGTIRHLAGRGEEGLNARVFYMASMFRYERPQAGRKRQFHQIGVEATGERHESQNDPR